MRTIKQTCHPDTPDAPTFALGFASLEEVEELALSEVERDLVVARKLSPVLKLPADAGDYDDSCQDMLGSLGLLWKVGAKFESGCVEGLGMTEMREAYSGARNRVQVIFQALDLDGEFLLLGFLHFDDVEGGVFQEVGIVELAH